MTEQSPQPLSSESEMRPMANTRLPEPSPLEEWAARKIPAEHLPAFHQLWGPKGDLRYDLLNQIKSKRGYSNVYIADELGMKVETCRKYLTGNRPLNCLEHPYEENKKDWIVLRFTEFFAKHSIDSGSSFVNKKDEHSLCLHVQRLLINNNTGRLEIRTAMRLQNGNYLLAGSLEGELRLAGTTYKSKARDFFILEVDRSIHPIRFELAGGPGDDEVVALVGAPDQSIYVVGGFVGNLHLGRTLLTSMGRSDIFVSRLSLAKQMSFVWAVSIGGACEDHAVGALVQGSDDLWIALDAEDSITIAGRHYPARGKVGIFLIRLSRKTGACLEVIPLGGAGINTASGLSREVLSGRLMLHGWCQSTWQWCPSIGEPVTIHSGPFSLHIG